MVKCFTQSPIIQSKQCRRYLNKWYKIVHRVITVKSETSSSLQNATVQLVWTRRRTNTVNSASHFYWKQKILYFWVVSNQSAVERIKEAKRGPRTSSSTILTHGFRTDALVLKELFAQPLTSKESKNSAMFESGKWLDPLSSRFVKQHWKNVDQREDEGERKRTQHGR